MCEDWIQEVLGLDFTLWMFHIENTRWPFSWAVGEANLLTVTAIATRPREREHAGTARLLWGRRRRAAALAEASRWASLRAALAVLRHCMRSGDECKTYCGHLPSGASSARTSCWPGPGQCCCGAGRAPVRGDAVCRYRAWGQVRGLARRGRSVSKGARLPPSARWGRAAREAWLEASCVIKSTLVRGSV